MSHRKSKHTQPATSHPAPAGQFKPGHDTSADGAHKMTNMNPNSDATAQANPGSAADPQFAQASVDKFEAAFDKAAEVAHGNVQALDASTSAFKTARSV